MRLPEKKGEAHPRGDRALKDQIDHDIRCRCADVRLEKMRFFADVRVQTMLIMLVMGLVMTHFGVPPHRVSCFAKRSSWKNIPQVALL
jgi:hypothetical protein